VDVLVHTGVLLGAIDADDSAHAASADVLSHWRSRLRVPVTVLAETAWQLERNVGVEAEAGLLDAVVAGELEVVDLTTDDYRRAVHLIREYADLGLGFVDASVVALSERLGITTIATLDRRDVAVVRPLYCVAFDLIP
jgi:uncharacterized protein